MLLKSLVALVIVGLGQLNYFFDHNYIRQKIHIRLNKDEELHENSKHKQFSTRFRQINYSIEKKKFIEFLTRINDDQKIITKIESPLGHIFQGFRAIWYGCCA